MLKVNDLSSWWSSKRWGRLSLSITKIANIKWNQGHSVIYNNDDGPAKLGLLSVLVQNTQHISLWPKHKEVLIDGTLVLTRYVLVLTCLDRRALNPSDVQKVWRRVFGRHCLSNPGLKTTRMWMICISHCACSS